MTDRWASFDCYGTLIDWERGIRETFTRLWPTADANALIARYHEVEPLVQRGSGESYRDVLRSALRRVAEAEGLAVADNDTAALGDSLPDWPPFPEVQSALAEVRDRAWRIAVLSNTDPDLLDASVRSIGVDMDLRITVADAGSYKPAPGHWERFREVTAVDHGRHVHVAASIFHDIEPAAALGIPAAWINRKGEQSDVPRAAEQPDLVGLADVLDRLVPPRGTHIG